MKAVIYARYSSDNQREESIEGQIRECQSFAERKGYTVIRTYIDRALSGTRADNRPQFQQLIRTAASYPEEAELPCACAPRRFRRDGSARC